MFRPFTDSPTTLERKSTQNSGSELSEILSSGLTMNEHFENTCVRTRDETDNPCRELQPKGTDAFPARYDSDPAEVSFIFIWNK